MGLFKSFVLLLIPVVLFAVGCDDEGSGGGIGPNLGNGDTDSVVTIFRPSPCQRIHDSIKVNVGISGGTAIDVIYITIDEVVYAVLEEAPYGTTIPSEILPSDGTHILKAIAVDSIGSTVSSEVKIYIDFVDPFYKNLLVVDADADPLELGGQPGAVFRINTDPGSGTICTLASSSSFVDPAGIAVDSLGHIFVSDLNADMDGTGPGVGTIFRILPDRFNDVEPLAVSGFFQAPMGLEIEPGGSMYVADYNASPTGIEVGSDGTPPGAIFAVDRNTGIVTTVLTDARLDGPVGVTVDIPTGDLWVVDNRANPYYGQHRGSVWKYDVSTGGLVDTPVAASVEFINPFEIRPDGAGNLVLTDSGDYKNGHLGKMFVIDPNVADPKTSAVLMKSGSPFRMPSGFIRRSQGDYLIADREADPFDDSYRGAILRYDPGTDVLDFLYTSDLFVTPIDVVESPD